MEQVPPYHSLPNTQTSSFLFKNHNDKKDLKRTDILMMDIFLIMKILLLISILCEFSN